LGTSKKILAHPPDNFSQFLKLKKIVGLRRGLFLKSPWYLEKKSLPGSNIFLRIKNFKNVEPGRGFFF